ncbi:hypothetical protein M3B20_07505 [Corynebacterium sanguinis]|uniref:hypothetical protein n=1 Tax=Corynebacterium sanguinis TaxID=2594913 RepID=UPI0021A2A35A|nr:hypothetical protein [Corynebacterium sanguinis]MCT1805568.1 hypothetical protein [Corynebacterium sanguinis]
MYLATALTGVTPLLGSSYLVHGAAGVGGSRSWVYASNSGQGLWETVGQSVQPMSTSKLYAPEGTTVVPTGRQVTTRGLGGDQYEIKRKDSTDRSGLASLGVAPTQPPAAAATLAGTQFTGTVLALSTTEVMNGEPAPNVYYVLQLDAPTPIAAMQSGGGSVTRTTDQLFLGEHSEYHDDSAQWGPLVGKWVTLTVDPETMWWQSDPSLPHRPAPSQGTARCRCAVTLVLERDEDVRRHGSPSGPGWLHGHGAPSFIETSEAAVKVG